MVTKKTLWVIIAIIVLLVAAVGGYLAYQAYVAPSGPKQIKVGVILPLTGGAAHEGWLARHAIEQAIDDINARGGVKSLGGLKLVPIIADSASTPATGLAEAERLITLEGVDVLTGCYNSAVTYPVAGAVEKHEIPFVVADSTSDRITEQGYKYTFRIHGKSSWYCRDSVKQIVDMNNAFHTNYKNIGLVYTDDEFGRSEADGFKSYLSNLTTDYHITFEESHPIGAADLTTLVTKLKDANPDIVVHAAYATDAILFVQTMKAAGWYPKMYKGLGAAGQSIPDFITGLGKDSEFVITDTEWQPDLLLSPAMHNYTSINDEFKIRTGSDMTGIPADCYSSTWILYYGIEKAGSLDKNKVRDALASINIAIPSTEVDVILPYERIDLTVDGQNPYTAIAAAQVINGTYRIIWPLAYATINATWPAPPWTERT
jgi:branched-chain amino acid transport system substrate-binding protein